MIVSAKVCPRCGVLLPVAAFTPDRSHADGLASRCRRCDADRSREYYHQRGGRAVKADYYQRRKAERGM